MFIIEKKKKEKPNALFLCIAPPVGLEPTTPRLTAACSTIELWRNTFCMKTDDAICAASIAPSKPHTESHTLPIT